MAKRRPKKSGPTVPEWVVTYGDMMSLLLCFFILLAAFSELKKDHQYQRVITAVKEAFGYSGGVGVMPTDDPPMRSMIQLLENLSKQELEQSRVSQSQDRGISGKRTKVTRVHDGLMFTIGGSLTFAPESAELMPEAKDELLNVAKLLRGRTNKISVRGHAARKPLGPGAGYADLRDLSYFRAKAVADYLSMEGGLPERVLVVDARGATEPVAVRRYSANQQTENRRVEIVMTEVTVPELARDALYTSESAARGGVPGG